MLDLDDIARVIATAVREATAPLLARIDALEQHEISAPEKGEPGEQGPPGEPGPAGVVDMDAVKALIDAAVAEIPCAERGEKGDPGTDGAPGEKGDDGAPGADGKDGVGLADALIDKDGALVLTMTDGRTKNLGQIHGKDGADGKDGATFTLDDFDVVPVDERTIKIGFVKGDVMHSFELAFPFPVYRGVFKDGEAYERGDIVTWGGSSWHCDEPKGLKPGGPDSGWQMMVKAGRAGRDAGK